MTATDTIRTLADAAVAAALAVVPELPPEDVQLVIQGKHGVILQTLIPWQRFSHALATAGSSTPTPGTSTSP